MHAPRVTARVWLRRNAHFLFSDDLALVVKRNDDFGSERAFRADETLVSEIDQNVLRSAKLNAMLFSEC